MPAGHSCLLHQVDRDVPSERQQNTPHHQDAEGGNSGVKTMIASFIGKHHRTWDLNAAQLETTGKAPAELALGWHLKGPLERLIYKPPLPQQAAYNLIERQQKRFTGWVFTEPNNSRRKDAQFFLRP